MIFVSIRKEFVASITWAVVYCERCICVSAVCVVSVVFCFPFRNKTAL